MKESCGKPNSPSIAKIQAESVRSKACIRKEIMALVTTEAIGKRSEEIKGQNQGIRNESSKDLDTRLDTA